MIDGYRGRLTLISEDRQVLDDDKRHEQIQGRRSTLGTRRAQADRRLVKLLRQNHSNGRDSEEKASSHSVSKPRF